MSDEQTADVLRKLGVLKARFKEKASGDIHMVALMAQDAAAGEGSLDELRRAYQVLHRLAGSAGTFGFRALGDEARALELILKPYVEAEPGIPEHNAGIPKSLLREHFIGRVLGLENLLIIEDDGQDAAELFKGPSADTSDQPVVLIIEPDRKAAEQLSSALTPHGFSIHCVTPKDLVSEELSRVSVVLIRDNVLISQEQIPWDSGDRPPFICISSRDTFDERYRLATLGVDGFVSEPVDVPLLVDYMERLVDEKIESGTGRVMVIDDDPELLERYSLILEGGGLEVRCVNSPSDILGVLSEFRPDIILMDVQMGHFNGPTLARMLRLDPEWVGLHIIFLSSEEDREFQFDALSQGGDDFLTKPVSDRVLLQAAKVRCYRARQLDKLASRDSLTGLLKHSLANSEVAKEHGRSQRLSYPSVVAMLDLDHFKQVNDRHGHRVGDLVIKGLANLLRHRLRKTDVIGRYGGEEFIVALPNCSMEGARQSMQAVCERMSKITFNGAEGPFSVTVSVGLAPLDAYDKAEEAIEAADRALYRRKSAGRNGVTAA
ncbi:diguanylate cyclase [Marinobacter sp. F3R08]|uniref:diguanylate cyclase n=1 Tax=Marinobacter sp. F3R08 TaxID=2841559 RepID=UPI001C092A24|nr:diguanylate cyclase [Marinobacter sp. F3R08]MBU2953136.1 diguanylate cyclase [Marinobacter sp. F3R08]